MTPHRIVPLLLFLLAPALGQEREQETLILRGRVHDGLGSVWEDAGVVIRGTRIVAVDRWDSLEVAENARTLTFPGAEITPGLVDAAYHPPATSLYRLGEQGSEVVPHLRVMDALELRDESWEKLARQGVTTVFVTADPTSVIGGQGVALKTAGSQRVVQRAGAIKATLGVETWTRGQRNHGPWGSVNHTTRRPTTRMGLVWVFRHAFAQARKGELEGPAGETLRQVLEGEIALRFQARHRKDIETAFRLARELGLSSFLLEEASEVHHMLPQLRAGNVPVIYGPLFDRPRGPRAFTGEVGSPALEAPALLQAAGVTFCLTASDRYGEDGLPSQAMLAIRYGLEPAAALRAVTHTPAELLGVGKRLGSLRAGLDADVVVWSGPPFEATSKPNLVLIDGQPVLSELPQQEQTATPAKPRGRF